MRKRFRHPLNVLLLAILVVFGIWEIASAWVLPNDGPAVTLSEYVWAFIAWGGWPAWLAVAGFCAWLTLHFLGRKFGFKRP